MLGDDPNRVLERAKYIHITLHVLLFQPTCFFWLSFFSIPLGSKVAEKDRCVQIIIETHLNDLRGLQVADEN